MQLLCSAAAHCGFYRVFELLKLSIRHKRKNCSRKSAAVDADSTFAAEKLLAERDGERHILLLDVPRRGHVLKQRPRRHTGLVDVAQKGIEMIVF